MLPWSLSERLASHARLGNVTEGYTADRTVEQLREPTQHVAERNQRIDGRKRPWREERFGNVLPSFIQARFSLQVH